MEEKNYRVLRIEEQLYGCEELPEGQPVLCDVLLEAADGTQRVLPYPDAELTRLDINEGNTVTLRDHRLAKAAHSHQCVHHRGHPAGDGPPEELSWHHHCQCRCHR